MIKIRTTRGEVFESYEENLLKVLQNQGIYLNASCGGKGTCGRCKVKVIEGKVRSSSFFGISNRERKSGYFLACQSYPESDILLEVPEQLITVDERISNIRRKSIEDFFIRNPELFDPLIKKISISLQPPTLEDSKADFERLQSSLERQIFLSTENAKILPEVLRNNKWSITFALADSQIISFPLEGQKIYGLSVDIGTTTVASALVDIEKGKVVDVANCYNSQIAYGDDVITRIIYAVENKGGLEKLRKTIVDDINALINTLLSKHGDGKILYVTLSGNTTMCHIFWGLNPKYIREEPYIPVFNHYPLWKAKDAGLNLEQSVPVYTAPSVAGYVGGDIVCGVIASEMYKDEEICLFIDIGTNGEVVIGNRDWLVTASTSAGPCFEGSGISCGMRAVEGAVEGFVFNRDTGSFSIKVIGNKEPKGICGSGMIDILSELFNGGIIDNKGKLQKNFSSVVRLVDEELKFFISESCYISQSDIDNIIRSKAAIYAGITTLLQEVGISEQDISKVYIAGGFGEFLNIKKAINIGMLPSLEEEKFKFLGNTSLTGAVLCLLSEFLKERAREIADKMTYIDLSRSKKFMDEYVSALFLPHTDIERFKKSFHKF